MKKKKLDDVVTLTKRQLLRRDLSIKRIMLYELELWAIRENKKLIMQEAKLRGYKVTRGVIDYSSGGD